MKQKIEPMRMLFSVTARGNGRRWMEELKRNHIHCHLQFSGTGTASSDMMDILGLDSSDKDLILSFGSETAVNYLAVRMGENIRNVTPVNGIMMVFSPTAINHLVAIMAARESENIEQKGIKKMTKSEFDYSLILVAVNHGYTDRVMQTAKKAGATGGTIIRARLADADQAEQFYGITLQAEREVVAIMTPGSTRDAIMEAVNAEFGLRTDGQAIICSLPVDKAFKL